MSDESNFEKKAEAPSEAPAPRAADAPPSYGPPAGGQGPAGRPPMGGYDRRPRPRGEDGGDRGPRGRGGRFRPFFKRKFCKFCSKKYPLPYAER